MVRLYYRDSLWSLIAGPTIWAAHFLISYISAALFCAKFAGPTSLDILRVIIAIATVVALVGIGFAGVQAADNWRQALNAEWAADANSLTMRRRFVGRAAFLLSGLSGVSVLYVGLTVLFVSSCR